MGLAKYVSQRLAVSALMLIGITLVLFVLYNLIQVDPLEVILPDVGFRNPVAMENAIQQWALDRPLPEQYARYMLNLLRGDLGTSFITRKPVSQDLLQRLPATIELAVCSILFATLIGVPLGLLAGLSKGSLFDRFCWFVSLVNASLPPFWVGLIFLTVFWYHLGIASGPGRLPSRMTAPPLVTGFLTLDSLLAGDFTGFRRSLGQLMLPTLVLGGFTLSLVFRLMRAAVIEEMNQRYVMTARSKGLPEHVVVLRHVLRNVLLPLITLVGLAFAGLIGGAVMTETVFDWPGVGQYLVDASLNLDYPAIQGGTLLVAVTYTGVNLIVDLLYAVLDPRVQSVT